MIHIDYLKYIFLIFVSQSTVSQSIIMLAKLISLIVKIDFISIGTIKINSRKELLL